MLASKKFQVLAVLAVSGFLGLLGPTPGSDLNVYMQERTRAHKALAQNDLDGAKRHWELALGQAKMLSGGHRAIILLEQSRLDQQLGNSDEAIRLLKCAEVELLPWPEPSKELREATIELIHIYESASQTGKVEYYRGKLLRLENQR